MRCFISSLKPSSELNKNISLIVPKWNRKLSRRYVVFWLFGWKFRDPHTNIGDSEYPGGMTTYCTAAAKSNSQGEISSEFWVNVNYAEGYGVNGGRYVQRMSPFRFMSLDWSRLLVTGCINPETLDQINPGDAGGQYDSSGGTDGQGNPAGSACKGYVVGFRRSKWRFSFLISGITTMWNYWNLLDLGLVFDAVMIQLIVRRTKVRAFFD